MDAHPAQIMSEPPPEEVTNICGESSTRLPLNGIDPLSDIWFYHQSGGGWISALGGDLRISGPGFSQPDSDVAAVGRHARWFCPGP
jgi:hypothetical protein